MANELKTIITADTSQFVNQFKNIKGSVSVLTDVVNKAKEAGKTFIGVDDDAKKFAKSLGNLGTSATSSKRQLMEMTNAINDIKNAYDQLSAEEQQGDFGTALLGSMDQLIERAGALKDNIMDTMLSINNAASDTRGFDQLSGAAGIVASSFQVAEGAAAMFGVSDEKLIKTMQKLQAIMAVNNGLQQIQNALQKQSAVMQGIMALQTKAAAVATSLQGKSLWAATVAQRAFNAAANANPYVILAGVILTVVGALISLGDTEEETSSNTKTLEDRINALSDKHKELIDNIKSANYVLLEIVSATNKWNNAYNLLKARIDDASTSIDKQKRLVDDYNKEWGTRMGYVKSYADLCKKANKEIADNFAKYKEAEVAQAKRAAYLKLATDAEAAKLKLEFLKKETETVLNAEREAQRKTLQQKLASTQADYKISLSSGNTVSAGIAARIIKEIKDELAKLEGNVKLNSNSNIVKQMNYYDRQSKFLQGKSLAALPEVASTLNNIPGEYKQPSTLKTATPKTDKTIKTSIEDPISKALKGAKISGSGIDWDILFPTETAKVKADEIWGTFSKELLQIMERQPLKGNIEMLPTNVDATNLMQEPRDLTGLQKLGQDFTNMFNPEGLDGAEGLYTTMGNSIGFAADQLNKVADAMSRLGNNNKTLQASVIIAQTLATLALSFAQAMTMESKAGVWGWIAAGIAGTAQLISMTAQLKSLNKGGYAEGGIIPGNSYYGDRLVANVNSGEMILNRRQQSNLFKMINTGKNDVFGAAKVEFEIRYDSLVGVLENGDKRNGKF